MTIMIRPFNEDDIEEFFNAVKESVDLVGKWLPWCTHDYSRTDADEWVSGAMYEWGQGHDFRFVICTEEAPKQLLGSVAINHINYEFQTANLGYWVRSSAIQNGFARAASLLACEYAFQYLGLTRIEIVALPENIASNKVAQSLRATFEGLLRNKIVHHNQPQDANCYSLIPNDILI